MSVSSDRPFFIVGSPRSGTTLMRVICDSHPALAVPSESHFVVGLTPNLVPWSRRRPPTIEDIVTHRAFSQWSIDADTVRRYVSESDPRTYPELIAAVFEAYAEKFGKRRWGDKTPGYVSYIPTLSRLFPNAQIIHMIRDGREVASSLVERRWGTRTTISGAFWWKHKIAKGLRDGRRLPPDRYMEVRLEDLISDPAREIHRVCEFLREEYSPAMLEYHQSHGRGRLGPDMVHLAKPPTAGLREWRAGLSRFEQRAVEAACRRYLMRLGYATPRWDPPAAAYARLVWARDLMLDGPAAVRARLSPATRHF